MERFSGRPSSQRRRFIRYLSDAYCVWRQLSYRIVDLNADNYPFKGLKNVESWKYDYHFKLIIATLLADLNRRNPSLLFRQAYVTLALIYFYCPTNKYIRISSYDSKKEGYIFNSHFFSIAMRYAESSWRTEEEFKLFAEMTMGDVWEVCTIGPNWQINILLWL